MTQRATTLPVPGRENYAQPMAHQTVPTPGTTNQASHSGDEAGSWIYRAYAFLTRSREYTQRRLFMRMEKMVPKTITLLTMNIMNETDKPRVIGGAMSGTGLRQAPPSPEDVTHVSACITYITHLI
jgi:hypothetical protein